MKQTRLSEKKVQKIIDEWNAEHKLEYRQKGFLMLKNDGNHRFLTQILKDGGTGQREILTDGSLRDCLNQMSQANNDLIRDKSPMDP